MAVRTEGRGRAVGKAAMENLQQTVAKILAYLGLPVGEETL
jgi:hypothetical protein